ncbi:MAG: DUF2202 domain-containing protein [Ferruginibacter sp.]
MIIKKDHEKNIFLAIVVLQSGFVLSQQYVSLTHAEKDAIVYMREEEKLARDVYDSMYAKWGGNPFGNIRQSEQVHMNRMKMLITKYQLQDPVEQTGDLQGKFVSSLMRQYYNELAAAGSQSITAALKAGAKIEELDIADLEERIKQTMKQDIIQSFEFLKMASHNHLRAFVRRLKMEGVDYVPVILNEVKFNTIINIGNTSGGCKKCD